MTTVPELLAELSRIAARDRADALSLELIAQRIADAVPARPTAHVAAAERTARRARATAATSSAALTLAHDTATELDRRTLEHRRTLADAEHARRLARLAFADAVAEVHDARANCDAVALEDGGHQAEAAHRLELAGQDLAEARDELARTDAEWVTAYRQEQTR